MRGAGLTAPYGAMLWVCVGCACDFRRDDVRMELGRERIRIERQGEPWLETAGPVASDDPARGGAAYAPFAAAKIAEREVEELYGAYRFNETFGAYSALVPVGVRRIANGFAFDFEGGGGGTLTLDEREEVLFDWRAPPRFDRVAMTFACVEGERFFGLGAQIAVEHTGRRVPVWTSEQGVGKAAYGVPALFGLSGAFYDSYAPVPFALSSARRGFFLDSYARSELELCERDGRLRIEADGRHFRLRVIGGESMREVLSRFATRTGTPPKLPLWAFAPWIDVFGGPEAIRSAAALLRGQGTPASAIWSEDWVGVVDTFVGENLSYDWEPDLTRFPDIAALTAELHAQGFRFLTYMNPYLAQGTVAHAEALAQGLLVSDPGASPLRISFVFGAPLFLIDLSTSAGAMHYAGYARRALDLGIDGWMADYAEALPYDAQLLDGRSGAEAHNEYPLMWARANFEALKAARPNGDFITFNRSGAAGISAWTSVHWLGDQLTSFDRNDGLGSVLPLTLSAGLSGIALTHSDIGGYTSDGAATVRDMELWARWLELGAFMPVMRTHHTSAPASNLQWSSTPETLALLDRYARWHQRLLPYFAALGAEASASGHPAVRPIWWLDEAPELFGIEDEALVGNDLLIAPIVTPMARARSVRLPSGAWRRWRSFAAPLEPTASGEIMAEAALDEAVLFVRAGAVLPLTSEDLPSVSHATEMPRFDLMAVSGGESEGEAHGVSWRWSAAAAESAQILHLDGAALAGEEVTLAGGATLSVLAPGRDALLVRIE